MANFTRQPKKILAESLTMLTTAFGLVAALAWNEAIKALIAEIVPKGSGTLSLFLYALLVTALVVLVTSRLAKLKQQLEQQQT